MHSKLEAAGAQDLREKIDQHYRVRLILDNLPITTYDLEENPESIRPGYEIGFAVDGKYYLNNHLMFKILVHKTNGQYSKARQDMAELEAAAVVEVGILYAACVRTLAPRKVELNIACRASVVASLLQPKSPYLAHERAEADHQSQLMSSDAQHGDPDLASSRVRCMCDDLAGRL